MQKRETKIVSLFLRRDSADGIQQHPQAADAQRLSVGQFAAGDPDDEGQLIVDELLDYLGYAGKGLW